MLRAALYFDQRLARHGHALELEHTNELRLADALFQPQAAYISADVYLVALYLLLHGSASQSEPVSVRFCLIVEQARGKMGPKRVHYAAGGDIEPKSREAFVNFR